MARPDSASSASSGSSGASGSTSGKGMKAAELAAFVSDAATEQVVKSLVQEQVMTFTTVRRGTIRDAIHYLETSLSPAILIIDISGITLPLSEIDRLMNACEPNVVVLVIGETNDIGLFRSLMQLGVSDYLVKPLTVELLRRTISTCSGDPNSNKPKMRTGKIVALTGARGGAGVTTVLANLGWTLANNVGRRVVMIDLDLQCSILNLMIGLKRSNSLVEAYNNAHRLDSLLLDRMLLPHGDKLFVLSAEESLIDDPPGDFSRIELLVKALEQRFHYVMLDMPRRPGALYKKVLDLAQVNVIIATPTIPSVRETIRILQLSGREEIGRRAIVILNNPAPATGGEVSVAEFETTIGRKVDYVLPYANNAILADNTGDLMVASHTGARQAFRKIANDLSGKGAEEEHGLSRVKRMLLGR